MTPAPPFAIALDGILAALCALLWGRFAAFGALAAPLHNRLNRARQRLARLLANLAAGRMPRPRAPRPGRRGGAPPVALPRGRAWLVAKLGYQAAGLASQLQHVLAQPGVAETLAASPGAARTLRPLCQVLGIALPAPLQRPPRPAPRPAPPRRPRPPAAKPTKLPPLLPLYPQRRPRPWPFPLPREKPG